MAYTTVHDKNYYHGKEQLVCKFFLHFQFTLYFKLTAKDVIKRYIFLTFMNTFLVLTY